MAAQQGASGAHEPANLLAGSGARVQRATTELPILHLEPEIPTPARWEIIVDGAARRQRSWSMADLRALPTEERVWDLSCVWGWTRPACRWEGVSAARLIDGAQPLSGAGYVLVRAIDGPYASCLTLEEARASLLAWKLDGEELTPEHGAPIRFVPPPTKWGFKGVKWVGHMTLLADFKPGFWEEMVGDPVGDIPPELMSFAPEDQSLAGSVITPQIPVPPSIRMDPNTPQEVSS